MTAHLRIARPVRDLQVSATMYERGLGLEVIGRFDNHEGFDGVMLGNAGADYHLELTCSRYHPLVPAPTPEALLVFYFPDPAAWHSACAAMAQAGFRELEAFNPYWRRLGRTFEDPDAYRVVIQQAAWTNGGLDAKPDDSPGP